jgi:hypothetical protein
MDDAFVRKGYFSSYDRWLTSAKVFISVLFNRLGRVFFDLASPSFCDAIHHSWENNFSVSLGGHMPLGSGELAQIVWAETKALGFGKGDGSGDVNDVRRLVAQLAASTNGEGFERREPPPDQNGLYRETVLGLFAICEAAQNAVPPQYRLIFWEAGDNTDRPNLSATPPPPAPWATMPAAGITYHGRYQSVGGGRPIDVFARRVSDGDDDRPVLVNVLTRTGMPGAAAQAAKAAGVPAGRWYRNLNWWIGLTGGALFFLAAFNLLWTANSFSQAFDLLNNRLVAPSQEFSQTLTLPSCPAGVTTDQTGLCATADELNFKDKKPEQQKAIEQSRSAKLSALLAKNGPDCTIYLTKWASDDRPAVPSPSPPVGQVPQPRDKTLETPCLNLLGGAVRYASDNLVVKGDGSIASVARPVLWWLLSWQVPTSGTQTVSLTIPASLMMLGVVLVLVGLGRGVNGTPLGALISPNGRYSLALAQVTFWTVLVLTSVVAIAIFNGGLVSEMVRYFPALEKGATQPVAVVNGFFPTVPNGIWAVLGISFGSTALSVLIKSIKGTASDSPTSVAADKSTTIGGVGFFKAPVAGYDPAHRASIADWFLGDDENTKDKIDISRVQMVLITAGLLITYGNAIFSAVQNLTPQEILLAIRNVDLLVTTLPPVGSAMAIMLAASHATYLVAKAANSPSDANDKPS